MLIERRRIGPVIRELEPTSISCSGWVSLGQNPAEIAYWERGEWWLAGDAKPWLPDAVTVVSDRLVFRPRLSPVA